MIKLNGGSKEKHILPKYFLSGFHSDWSLHAYYKPAYMLAFTLSKSAHMPDDSMTNRRSDQCSASNDPQKEMCGSWIRSGEKMAFVCLWSKALNCMFAKRIIFGSCRLNVNFLHAAIHSL